MARKRASKRPFDFENAVVGQPGPDGSPVIDTFVTDSGIPGVETRSAQGLRTFTFPLAALRRQPVTRVIPPPPEAAPKRQPARVARMLALAHDLQDKLDCGEYPDQATLNKYKMAKHFILHIEDDSFDYELDQQKVNAEAALDGVYVVRTSVANAATMGTDQAVRSYKQLANVERAFRCLKSADLMLRRCADGSCCSYCSVPSCRRRRLGLPRRER